MDLLLPSFHKDKLSSFQLTQKDIIKTFIFLESFALALKGGGGSFISAQTVIVTLDFY